MEPSQQLSALLGSILMSTALGRLGVRSGAFSVEAHVRAFLEGQGGEK